MRRKLIAAALALTVTAANAGLILSERVPPGWYFDLAIGIESFGLILSE